MPISKDLFPSHAEIPPQAKTSSAFGSGRSASPYVQSRYRRDEDNRIFRYQPAGSTIDASDVSYVL